MKQLRKLGVDPGFGNIKIAEVQNGSIVTFAMSSAVGLVRDRKDGLSMNGIIRTRRRQDPYRITFDNVEYLVGPNVSDFTKPFTRMDFDRFTDSPELRATLYAALYRIINNGACDIALAMGLPVKVLEDETEAARVERGIRKWLLGIHKFSVNDSKMALNIVTVRAKIAQPVASWFEMGLNNEGQWIKGDNAASAPALIIDQGFNTLDVLVVHQGRISSRHTSGDTLGMRRAAERLGDTLLRRYDLDLDLTALDGLVQRVVNGKQAEVWVEGKAINVSQETKQALNSLQADVVSFVERSVGLAKEYEIILTGGGALAMTPRLIRLFPHANVVYQPVLANARGLAKMANRPGFLN